MKTINKIIFSISIFISLAVIGGCKRDFRETITFSPAPWCDVTMPTWTKLGEKITIKVDYKDIEETNLGCVMTYRSTARGKGGFFPCTSPAVKAKGTGTLIFHAKVPLRYGMTELTAKVFLSPDKSWGGRTHDTAPKTRKAKKARGTEAFAIPVVYDKVLTRPEDDWHKKVRTKNAKVADWCEIIVPKKAAIGKRMDVTVKYKELEPTHLTCTLQYVLEGGEEGYMSTAVQGTEEVKETGQKTYWLPVLDNVEKLKALKVSVFLSKEGNWRTKTKTVKTKEISIQKKTK